MDPLSQAITAEHLRGDEELELELAPWSALYLGFRIERDDFFRLFRRSSNTCGAIPLMTSREEGLKLAITDAMDEEDACVDVDKP